MGGLCKQKETGKKGVVLGILKKGITTAKVQWENNGEIADVPIYNLEHIDPNPFSVKKLTGITLELLKFIARLSGITNEIKMPQCHLTPEEEKLLLSDNSTKNRNKTIASDSQLYSIKNSDGTNSKRNIAKTVESWSNEMVSNIMGEIRKMSSEKLINQDETQLETDEEQTQQIELKRQLMIKLLNVEHECLQLAFIQCSALKVLNLLLTTNEYSQNFLFPSVFDKEISCESSAEKTETIKWIMSHVANKSIQQCKLKHIISLAEIERAESILQLNYVKCKSEEDLSKIFSCEVPKTKQRAESECRPIPERPATSLYRPSESQINIDDDNPCKVLVNSTHRQFNRNFCSGFAYCYRKSRVPPGETDSDILLREERCSPPPVPPPIAAPLLEMGFPLKHIINAINVTKSSGEVSAHAINILASWMLEHPFTETSEGESSSGLTRSESIPVRLSKMNRAPPVQEVILNIFVGAYC